MTLAQSKNLVFNYSTFNDVHGNYYQNATAPGERGIDKLYHKSCPDAVYDSQGRYPPPNCLPGTRRAVLKEILGWIHTNEGKFLWLYGPAGVGKSAIAQTVAEICAEEGILVASFFFSRDSPGRDTSKRLIPSIVYQLAISMPGKRTMVGKIIEEDVSILKKSVNAQAQALIFSLFIPNSMNTPTTGETRHSQPFLIIIDGLDECNGDDKQREVVRVIGQLLHSAHIPFRFFFASRPEPQIKSAFRLLTHFVHKISLSDPPHMLQGKKDVFTFLEQGFKEIVRKHHETMVYAQEPWPGNYIIAELTSKAGGMFIYASTVLKYVDDDNYSPSDRLREVIDTPPGRTPFAELDRLYKHILSKCNEPELLLQILGILLLQITHRSCSFGEIEIEILLQLPPGTVRRVLKRTHSILEITKFGRINFFHASFGDFILNETRAGIYYIDRAGVHALMAEALITFMGTWSGFSPAEDKTDTSRANVMEYGLDLWSHHCSGAHWPSYRALLEKLFLHFDFWWWKEYTYLRNAGLEGLLAGLHWLKNLDHISQHLQYSSFRVRKRITEMFWLRAFQNDIPPPLVQRIELYKVLDDQTIDELMTFESISWGRRKDWVDRSLWKVPVPGGKPRFMIKETISSSRLTANIITLGLDKTSFMGCILESLKEIIQVYLQDLLIATGGEGSVMLDHIRVSIWCVSVLIRNTTEDGGTLYSENSAFQYASKYWAQHIYCTPLGNQDVIKCLEVLDLWALRKKLKKSDIKVILNWLEGAPSPAFTLIEHWKNFIENKNAFSRVLRRILPTT